MSEPVVIAVGDLHDVVVGRGVLERVPGLVPDAARQVLVVRPEGLERYASAVAAGLRDAGLVVHEAAVPDAERAKTSAVAAELWAVLGQHAFTRTDVVVSVGGGTVTDLAGFVAATWLRGVPVVHVPTTLLAMVDAAVGGKTGINTAEGKNLVGAFHSPAGVVCDLDVLETLPPADLVAGLAEVVKGGFIADPRILELVEGAPADAARWDSPVLAELVRRKVAVKAEVVAADPREAFRREVLNYGHTLGHAVEQVSGFGVRHGEAVAVGMVFAAELGHRTGTVSDELLARHRSVLAAVGLPTTYDGASFEALLAAMARDKKSRGSLLRFVVLDGLANPVRLEGPDESLLRAALDALAP
ncbi:3-dehydroquinate synthase [Phycicoccus sonneratiae]|uniref:3-dehydroquinate synthase n=1 Tax=Phycicoccus sonneratiae TaxID=2807628 RepID=A0ABS2CHS8_9MICO|nr:3-dehydroquinate synthase [Phycicoccus sonneraticus]MBM6399421.1 3-dehydroquinate synthase [Phycicoccus sonneraticus]